MDTLDIAHVPADDSQLSAMTAAAKAGKLVATPPTEATRAAGWLPHGDANFLPVLDDPIHAAGKLAEYRTKHDPAVLETIRLNGMKHVTPISELSESAGSFGASSQDATPLVERVDYKLGVDHGDAES